MWWKLLLIIGGIFLISIIYFTIRTLIIIKALHSFHFPLPKIEFNNSNSNKK
jgi:hypothetical protein